MVRLRLVRDQGATEQTLVKSIFWWPLMARNPLVQTGRLSPYSFRDHCRGKSFSLIVMMLIGMHQLSKCECLLLYRLKQITPKQLKHLRQRKTKIIERFCHHSFLALAEESFLASMIRSTVQEHWLGNQSRYWSRFGYYEVLDFLLGSQLSF